MLADYGADGGQGRRRCPGPARCRSSRPSTPTRATGACSGSCSTSRPTTGATRSCAWPTAPTWSSRRSAPASSTASASATTTCPARNPGIVYCSTRGYGQTGPRRDVGRPRRQLPGRRRLPRLHRAAPGDGRPALPGATVADIAAGGMQAVMAIMAALLRRERTGDGALPRRVHRRRRAVAMMSLYVDEYLATGVEPGPGPLHPHRPVRLLRHLRVRRRPVRRGRRHRAAVLAQPVPAARPASSTPSHQIDDDVQDEIRAAFGRGVRHPDPRRVGGRAGPGRHLRRAGATPWPRPSWTSSTAAAGLVADAVHATEGPFRQSAPDLGRHRRARRRLRDPRRRRHRHRRAAGRGRHRPRPPWPPWRRQG